MPGMAWYRKTKLEEMQKKRWRTVAAIDRKDGLRIEAGREVTIEHKRGGLTLRGPACATCGLSFHCRKVPPSYIEEIPE